MNHQVNWEIQALDQAAGFLRDDPIGVAALWDTVSQLADEPRPPESFPYGSPDLRRLRARGRESNTAHVVTGKTAPPGHQPYQQAAPESVLAGVLQRDAGDLSATEQIRQAQEQSGGTSHLLTLWSAAVRQTLHPQIDERIKARLTDSEAWRYEHEHSRQALQHKLRQYQFAGHDISQLIDRICAAPMDGARSISSVLHGRLQRVPLPGLGHAVTWAQRTPKDAPQVAHELAAGLDERRRELGERLAVKPEPWLTRYLGVLSPDASPALREEYVQRAGTAAAYREARDHGPTAGGEFQPASGARARRHAARDLPSSGDRR